MAVRRCLPRKSPLKSSAVAILQNLLDQWSERSGTQHTIPAKTPRSPLEIIYRTPRGMTNGSFINGKSSM